MDRILPRTFCQWKSPPTLICSTWNSPDRNDSVDAAHRVVDRLIEVLHEVSVESDFRSEELRVQHRVFVARGAVEPGKVAVRERGEVVHAGSGVRGLQGFRKECCAAGAGAGVDAGIAEEPAQARARRSTLDGRFGPAPRRRACSAASSCPIRFFSAASSSATICIRRTGAHFAAGAGG